MIRFDHHKYSGISTPPRFSPVGYGVNEQFASFRLTCLRIYPTFYHLLETNSQ